MFVAHFFKPSTIEALVRASKQQWVVEQLRLLRATDPNPPMVSILDIGEDDMRDLEAFTSTASTTLASTASSLPAASTATLCICCRLKDAELYRLRRLNAVMRARLAAAQRGKTERPLPSRGVGVEAEMLKPRIWLANLKKQQAKCVVRS